MVSALILKYYLSEKNNFFKNSFPSSYTKIDPQYSTARYLCVRVGSSTVGRWCVKLEIYVFIHKTHAHFVPTPTHSLWGNNSVMFYIGRGMDTGQQCAGL